jgi:hypothetical protein
MKAGWIILVASILALGQTATKKETTPTNKKGDAPGKTDTWQRSKECAAQAEKIVAEWPRRTGATPEDWHNHYSPKYDKCFVTLYFSELSKDEKIYPSYFSTALFDAFERSAPIASTCTLLRGNSDCAEQIVKTTRDVEMEGTSKALNGKSFGDASAAEQESVHKIVGDIRPNTTCSIDGLPVHCANAATFVLEHMKN